MNHEQQMMELWRWGLLNDDPCSYDYAPKEIKAEFDRFLNGDLDGLHPDDDFFELWDRFCERSLSILLDEEFRS